MLTSTVLCIEVKIIPTMTGPLLSLIKCNSVVYRMENYHTIHPNLLTRKTIAGLVGPQTLNTQCLFCIDYQASSSEKHQQTLNSPQKRKRGAYTNTPKRKTEISSQVHALRFSSIYRCGVEVEINSRPQELFRYPYPIHPSDSMGRAKDKTFSSSGGLLILPASSSMFTHCFSVESWSGALFVLSAVRALFGSLPLTDIGAWKRLSLVDVESYHRNATSLEILL